MQIFFPRNKTNKEMKECMQNCDDMMATFANVLGGPSCRFSLQVRFPFPKRIKKCILRFLSLLKSFFSRRGKAEGKIWINGWRRKKWLSLSLHRKNGWIDGYVLIPFPEKKSYIFWSWECSTNNTGKEKKQGFLVVTCITSFISRILKSLFYNGFAVETWLACLLHSMKGYYDYDDGKEPELMLWKYSVYSDADEMRLYTYCTVPNQTRFLFQKKILPMLPFLC